ncbi:hypothetical protein J1N35_014451 [Gossypium stocksii]|uniref:Uncharacterized protein n=1 Tax=Gossypium stocksii TaxID=47602 RepID=A0A9D3VUU0_9ROSI|nr:hypothetical protein J1N35_014451 [Gossypium stocksii]
MGKENEEEQTIENLERENDELVLQLDWWCKSKEQPKQENIKTFINHANFT